MASSGIVDLSTGFPGQPPDDLAVGRFLDRLCDRWGFDYAAYAGRNPLDNAVYGHVNYPSAWKRHYVEQGFHRVDPTILMAARSIAPVDWRRLENHEGFRAVFRDARDFGITERGLTVPVRGPYGDIGMLSVTRDCSVAEWDKILAGAMADLQGAAVHLHDAVVRGGGLMRALRSPTLSSREREVLQWVAVGKTQPDIADILSLALRTVEVHLRSAREKLHALTTAQAVARAVALGLVEPH